MANLLSATASLTLSTPRSKEQILIALGERDRHLQDRPRPPVMTLVQKRD